MSLHSAAVLALLEEEVKPEKTILVAISASVNLNAYESQGECAE